MWKLQRPIITVGQALTASISRIRDPNLKARLQAAGPVIDAASAQFEAATTNLTLHTIPKSNRVSAVTKTEMVKVYDDRMAKKNSPGRDIYDEIMALALDERCPLCGQRTVSTLDHHLPKTEYPALAVTPINLVPACIDCNKIKLSTCPTSQSDEPIHPYFDDLENDLWLTAEVRQTVPAALKFKVTPPPNWGHVTTSRVRIHFESLKLSKLYGSHAATELLNIRHELRITHTASGPAGVRAELNAKAISRRAAFINSWQTAAYTAWSTSNWFCDGGFG